MPAPVFGVPLLLLITIWVGGCVLVESVPLRSGKKMATAMAISVSKIPPMVAPERDLRMKILLY
jgi:hypothetical protein